MSSAEEAAATGPRSTPDEDAGERYLLLADLTGYSGFMAGVEDEHGIDFGEGIPAAYSVLGDLLDTVVRGVEPDFDVVKLEGDAVFAAAPAGRLDDEGEHVLAGLASMYDAFVDARTRAIPSSDHRCTACPSVAHLDLKAVLHRGPAVRQAVGPGWDLLGPSVTVAHRLLKNTVRDRVGARPYLFVSDAAVHALGLTGIGIAHREAVSGAGDIDGRIVLLDGSDPPPQPS